MKKVILLMMMLVSVAMFAQTPKAAVKKDTVKAAVKTTKPTEVKPVVKKDTAKVTAPVKVKK